MAMKFKVKCSTQKEYDTIKSYLDDLHISYKQKDGKSLKVDCCKNELMHHLSDLSVLGVHPVSIKPCKGNEHPEAITGYCAVNNADGFGLVEQYDMVSEMNRMLPPEGIHCADDIKEYRSIMRQLDPTGLTQAVFERSNRSFVGDDEYEYDEYDM